MGTSQALPILFLRDINFIMRYLFLMELADPDGVLCICLHFVCCIRMNAFLAHFKISWASQTGDYIYVLHF